MKNPSQVLVIASDRAYGLYALNLIGSVQQHSDIFEKIYVYDLGLTPIQRLLLSGVEGVELKTVDPFVSHWRQCWSWKPWVWVNVPGEVVLYLDAGVTVLKDLTPLLNQIADRDYLVVSEGLPLGPSIPEQYYELYKLPAATGGEECIAGGIIGFKKKSTFFRKVILPTLEDVRLGRNLGWSKGELLWRNEGINYLKHPPVRDCQVFRHDQTLLNIHFYRAITKPRVEPIDRFHWENPQARSSQLIWHHRRSVFAFPYLALLRFKLPPLKLIARLVQELALFQRRVQARLSSD